MINLYTWSTPNGRKISIMLEETGLPYVVHPVDLGKNDQFDEDFLQISPNNKIPAIVDEENGCSMMESGAILMYLAEKTGMLMPEAYRWQILEWLMWQMSGVGPNCGQAHHYMHFSPGVSEYTEKRLKVEIQRLYTVLDDRLEENEFVAGDYSIADISLWPWVSRFEWHRVDLDEFENVKRWYLETAGRPAVLKGYDIPETGSEIPIP
ncbi:MAG: glutathione S-transferase N-terminal domain-containing protein [Gammaproteobacteria bacterium]|nr:glutathione S-transferase N-terminal domain-containing protein [Gammaproteobacteria bacterium]